jgi:hypothetical protein
VHQQVVTIAARTMFFPLSLDEIFIGHDAEISSDEGAIQLSFVATIAGLIAN